MALERIWKQKISGCEVPYPQGTVCIGGASTSDFFDYPIVYEDVVKFPYPPTTELVGLLAQALPDSDFLFTEPKLSELAGKILEAKNPGSIQRRDDLPDGRELRMAYGWRTGRKEDWVSPHLLAFLLVEFRDTQESESN